MAKLGFEVEGRLKGVYSLFVEVDEIKRLLNPENQYQLDQVGQVSVPDYESKITKEDIDACNAGSFSASHLDNWIRKELYK